MKKKFFNTLSLVGLLIFVFFLLLALKEIISLQTLWVKYVLTLSALAMFVGLSNVIKKFTDYNEGMSCLKRVIKSLNFIKNTRVEKINYVRILSIKNQLNNAEIYLGNVVNNFDLHELKGNLAHLETIESHYHIDSKATLTNDIMENDSKYILETYENVKFIKSRNPLIK